MREGAKQRLVGATVIVALAVIFVPMFFEKAPVDRLPAQGAAPQAPAFDPRVKSEVFLGPGDSGVGGLSDAQLTDSQPLALPSAGDAQPAPAAGTPLPPSEPPPPEPTDEGPGSESPPPVRQSATEAPPPAPPAAADGMPSWVIQVASVASPEAAAEMERKLKAGGYSAFVEKAQVNGKTYFRVRVGPETERARAEQTAARLRERYKLNTLIKNYP